MCKYLNSIFLKIILVFFAFLVSCIDDEVLPATPIIPTPNPVVSDTVPEPILFPFVVKANVNDLLSWNKESYLYAKTIINNQEISLKLYVDSIFEDSKTAWFVDTLSFVPSDTLKWKIYRPAIVEDMSIQDGTKESLLAFISLNAIGLGSNPEVTFESDIHVLKLLLPAGVAMIECSQGFYSKILLAEASSVQDYVFVAVPDSCQNDINVTLTNSEGIVFRSRRLNIEQSAKLAVDSISLVNFQKLSLKVGTPYSVYLDGNYSGITWLGNNSYAVVDDNFLANGEGWHSFEISLSENGQIDKIDNNAFIASGLPNRDLEGIAYNPSSRRIWLSGERDNVISEHFLSGERTGRTLNTTIFDTAVENAGLEALAYNDITKRYWTTTESGLPMDGGMAHPLRSKTRSNTLRFQSYDADCMEGAQYLYETDKHQKKEYGDLYAFGVPSICALDDGRLLVLERECQMSYVVDGEVGFCYEKLFLVDPTNSKNGDKLSKTLLLELSTSLVVSHKDKSISGELVNYEGMCLGPYIDDSSRVLFFVSDSGENKEFAYSLDSESYISPDTFLPIELTFADE